MLTKIECFIYFRCKKPWFIGGVEDKIMCSPVINFTRRGEWVQLYINYPAVKFGRPASCTYPNLPQQIDVDQVPDEPIRLGIHVHMSHDDARVVHQYVDGAQVRPDGSVHGSHLLLVGHVHLVAHGRTALPVDRPGRLSRPFAVDVGASYFGTQLVETHTQFAAQAPSRSRHLSRVSLQFDQQL